MSVEDRRPEVLSPSEWRVLACVYDLGSATAAEVSERLRRAASAHYSVKTAGIFLSRLRAKGYLAAAAHRLGPGRPLYSYSPLLPRSRAVRLQIEAFLASFVLSDEDLESVASFLEAHRAAKSR